MIRYAAPGRKSGPSAKTGPSHLKQQLRPAPEWTPVPAARVDVQHRSHTKEQVVKAGTEKKRNCSSNTCRGKGPQWHTFIQGWVSQYWQCNTCGKKTSIN
ncbi:MAG: hypothetical protein MUE46_19875 [Xanthomonadales bacterium]|nr:hypothetical protein [Xanthomonadales bacterium]